MLLVDVSHPLVVVLVDLGVVGDHVFVLFPMSLFGSNIGIVLLLPLGVLVGFDGSIMGGSLGHVGVPLLLSSLLLSLNWGSLLFARLLFLGSLGSWLFLLLSFLFLGLLVFWLCSFLTLSLWLHWFLVDSNSCCSSDEQNK